MTRKQPEEYIGETENNLNRLREGELDVLITAKEAAQLSGYHPDYIRKLLQTKKVQGRKWGNAWMVDKVSLLAYLQKIEVQGEKRGPKAA